MDATVRQLMGVLLRLPVGHRLVFERVSRNDDEELFDGLDVTLCVDESPDGGLCVEGPLNDFDGDVVYRMVLDKAGDSYHVHDIIEGVGPISAADAEVAARLEHPGLCMEVPCDPTAPFARPARVGDGVVLRAGQPTGSLDVEPPPTPAPATAPMWGCPHCTVWTRADGCNHRGVLTTAEVASLLAIWWTSEGEARRSYRWVLDGVSPLTTYVAAELASRVGRVGRGRLWVSTRLGLLPGDTPVEWPDGRIAAWIEFEAAAGIVVLRQDLAFCFADQPYGVITDLQLRRLA